MELSYTYGDILQIAKEVKKFYKLSQLVEMVQFVFQDEVVLHIFVRYGLKLKSNDEAIEKIGEAMADGEDFFEIQQDVIRGLIKANFYKKELEQILQNITTTAQEQTQEA